MTLERTLPIPSSHLRMLTIWTPIKAPSFILADYREAACIYNLQGGLPHSTLAAEIQLIQLKVNNDILKWVLKVMLIMLRDSLIDDYEKRRLPSK